MSSERNVGRRGSSIERGAQTVRRCTSGSKGARRTGSILHNGEFFASVEEPEPDDREEVETQTDDAEDGDQILDREAVGTGRDISWRKAENDRDRGSRIGRHLD